MSRGMPILAICYSTRSLKSTGKQGLCDITYIHTHKHTTHGHHNLETELAQCAKSVKISQRSNYQWQKDWHVWMLWFVLTYSSLMYLYEKSRIRETLYLLTYSYVNQKIYNVNVSLFSLYLADPGKARGCSTNSVIIVVVDWVSTWPFVLPWLNRDTKPK